MDLRIKFKDIDLSPMTPYSGKYVGYKIQKGKLFMDLKYQIINRKLDSQNKIFFDQFTLGDKVESPQATKLPVRLAISLLKDRKGEIHLDIPVTGSLDDPKFSVFSIILQVLGNLIAKAATSPFALIGAIMGGGEQLDLAKDLPNPEMEKLMLTNILINEADLRALASQRSARVRDTLVKAGVESDRLFIVEPKSLAPEKKDKIKNSRVDFRLK